jgi:hypothetical protein
MQRFSLAITVACLHVACRQGGKTDAPRMSGRPTYPRIYIFLAAYGKGSSEGPILQGKGGLAQDGFMVLEFTLFALFEEGTQGLGLKSCKGHTARRKKIDHQTVSCRDSS